MKNSQGIEVETILGVLKGPHLPGMWVRDGDSLQIRFVILWAQRIDWEVLHAAKGATRERGSGPVSLAS